MYIPSTSSLTIIQQGYYREGVALQCLGRHAEALAAFSSGLAQVEPFTPFHSTPIHSTMLHQNITRTLSPYSFWQDLWKLL